MLELHAIAAKKEESGATFAVAMTQEEQRRFVTGMSGDVEGAYLDMLGRVDSETSECSRPSDQESIHAAIRDSIGFGKLNRMLFEVMEGWAEGQLRARADEKMAVGKVLEAMDCNRSLASFLKQQGKYDAALLLEKQILEVYQNELDATDPGIGKLARNCGSGLIFDALQGSRCPMSPCRTPISGDTRRRWRCRKRRSPSCGPYWTKTTRI